MIAQEKRDILAKNLPDDSCVLLFGKTEQIRNGDVFYPFRQDSDFLLLTGLDIPDLLLCGIKRDDTMRWILSSDELTEKEKLWGSARVGYEELASISGIMDIREGKSFRKEVKNTIKYLDHVFVKKSSTTDQKYNIQKMHLSGVKEKLRPLEPLLTPLRMIKTPEEIEKIRKAISITHEAYEKIRANIKPQMYEYEVEALIAGVFRSHHATEAYPTIVASGSNACTLHYERNTRKIESGDIVLIDFGAEYEGYAADITRMFQVSSLPGKGEVSRGVVSNASDRQLQIYTSVLTVKNYAESLIKPGVKKLEYEKLVRDRMNDELEKLGLIPNQSSPEEKEKLSRKYYPHSVSHFLGLDVHDTGERDQIFEAGMVITCEPGIYIPEEGIGIRLEDDILITESGCENLSRSISLGF